MFGYLPGLICLLCNNRLHVRAGDASSSAGFPGEIQLCQHCLASLPWRNSGAQMEFTADGDPLIAPLEYASCAAEWVLRAKRSSGLVEARLLGALLAHALLDVYSKPAARPDFLIPVPLSWQRLLWRGHNQATLIAAPVHRCLGIRILHTAVRRIRHTPIQPGRSGAGRRANVQATFANQRRWQGERVAILDDVFTTGATVTALAQVLRQAGAGEVHVWCATRTRSPRSNPSSRPGL